MPDTNSLLIEILVEEPSAEEVLKHLLPKLLRGRSRHKIIVLIDQDDDDCQELKNKLEAIAQQTGLFTKSKPNSLGEFVILNRIVIEELESWFIGDAEALCKAFSSLPSISPRSGIFRNPDNGGSWEALHRFLKKNGIYL